jgi:hypothetical protein
VMLLLQEAKLKSNQFSRVHSGKYLTPRINNYAERTGGVDDGGVKRRDMMVLEMFHYIDFSEYSDLLDVFMECFEGKVVECDTNSSNCPSASTLANFHPSRNHTVSLLQVLRLCALLLTDANARLIVASRKRGSDFVPPSLIICCLFSVGNGAGLTHVIEEVVWRGKVFL